MKKIFLHNRKDRVRANKNMLSKLQKMKKGFFIHRIPFRLAEQRSMGSLLTCVVPPTGTLIKYLKVERLATNRTQLLGTGFRILPIYYRI